jgi:hypothetical protein
MDVLKTNCRHLSLESEWESWLRYKEMQRSSPVWHTCKDRTVGVMASGGSRSKISTLETEERSLNWLRAFTR